ncbi:hypothetical protein ABIA27_005009 [Sinorhizobium fredii]
MPDHVHMLISIPPKYSVSHIVGFLKGKTALYVANKYARKRRYKGYHFWARGYFVSAMMSRSSDDISVIKKRPTKLPTLPTSLTVATLIAKPLLAVQAQRFKPPPLVEVMTFSSMRGACLRHARTSLGCFCVAFDRRAGADEIAVAIDIVDAVDR